VGACPDAVGNRQSTICNRQSVRVGSLAVEMATFWVRLGSFLEAFPLFSISQWLRFCVFDIFFFVLFPVLGASWAAALASLQRQSVNRKSTTP
jgi:hypothetical protein